MSVLNTIRKTVEPVVLNLGYNIWDILFEKEGGSKFLRVYIFKDDGVNITLDDCELVSNKVSKKLDEIDVVNERYYLEVSSVGVDRKLAKEKHFINSIGKNVYLKFKKTFEGRKNLKGVLKEFKEGNIKIQTKDEVFCIPTKNCSYIKLDGEIEEF